MRDTGTYLSWQVKDKSTSEERVHVGARYNLEGWLQLSSGSLGSLSGNLDVDGSDMVWLQSV